MKAHRCAATTAAEHRIAEVKALPHMHRYGAVRCLCHGHCGTCGQPVTMCRLGKYHHQFTDRAARSA